MVMNRLSLTEELVLALYPCPFKGIITYLSPSEALTQVEFNKSQLTKKYWLYQEDEGTKPRGKRHKDPDCLFRIFSVFLGEGAITVCEHMLKWVSDEFNNFSQCSWIALHMNKYKSLSTWMSKMRNPAVPADEIALYALTRMFNRHTLIYTGSSIWSTVASSKPLTYGEVCNECQVRLVFLGKGHFVELIKRPVAQNTTVPFAHAENVYDSSYYKPITGNTPLPKCDYLSQQPTVTTELDHFLNANAKDNEMFIFNDMVLNNHL